MNTDKEAFVYAVCGDAEHINTLNYSLKALRKYSDQPIIVVTDPARNKGTIEHNNIVEVTTPAKFNNHQASIYIKTGLHKFLPAGKTYCYLDSDVIAIDEHINSIFKQFITPISFAADHCTMNQFSPFAVNCSCKDDFEAEITEFRKLESEHYQGMVPYREALKAIDETTAYNKRHLPALIYNTVRYYLSGRYYALNEDYLLDKHTQQWLDYNRVSLEERYGIHRFFEKRMHLTWSPEKGTYLRANGTGFFELSCNHLAEQIEVKFKLHCQPYNWQHWNGGVFVFNDSSFTFLDDWHQTTLEIFNEPAWKTRDQGTLIATTFKHRLQNQPVLDRRYNYIVDYTSSTDKFNPEMICETREGKKIKPFFLHVFHHFGDSKWKFWNDLENYLGLRLKI